MWYSGNAACHMPTPGLLRAAFDASAARHT